MKNEPELDGPRSDPVAFVVGVGVLLITLALAIVVPLRRATRIDPIASLRAE